MVDGFQSTLLLKEVLENWREDYPRHSVVPAVSSSREIGSVDGESDTKVSDWSSRNLIMMMIRCC